MYIRVVFLKIGEIDTLKENFMADAFIQACWREPALDGQASQVGNSILHAYQLSLSVFAFICSEIHTTGTVLLRCELMSGGILT